MQGSIEEKVYQRQISKQGLSGAVIDFKNSDIQFSQEDLKVQSCFRVLFLLSTVNVIDLRVHTACALHINLQYHSHFIKLSLSFDLACKSGVFAQVFFCSIHHYKRRNAIN